MWNGSLINKRGYILGFCRLCRKCLPGYAICQGVSREVEPCGEDITCFCQVDSSTLAQQGLSSYREIWVEKDGQHGLTSPEEEVVIGSTTDVDVNVFIDCNNW